jgi:hypothetical protein
MPLFSYRAINEDSKEVQGSIEAVNLDAAKAALADLHLEPVEVNEAMRLRKNPPADGVPAEQPLLKTAYAFEGKENGGTVRKGTIQAATKRQAFDRLRHDQSLTVTMLTPLGVPAQSPDLDLQRWQSSEPPQPKPIPQQQRPVPPKAWNPVEERAAPVPPPMPAAAPRPVTTPTALDTESATVYHPVLSTLRLYAGWLLAWYALFAAFGYYYSVRELSVDIPIVQGFASSALVTTFILGIFLFLLFSSLHRSLNGGKAIGALLTLLALGGFVGLRMLLV